MKIPFTKPDINEDDIAAVAEVLRSGWITTGPVTKAFERELSRYCGSARTVCMNSQTMCAEMCLRLLGIGPGDEVIVPAYTYSASCSIVEHVGAKAVMIDLQPEHFEMDYEKLAAAINARTKLIIPVDLAGVVCDYARIFEIARAKRGLFRPANPLQEQLGRVIVQADAAHSLGARRAGKRVGAIADFSCFSFHAVKNLTTAEGGAVTWNPELGLDDEAIYKQLMLLALHGQNKDALSKTQRGGWEYDIVAPYYKGNMTDVAAAMGLSQLRRYEAMLARRRALIERYDAAFLPLGARSLPHYTAEASSSGHLYLLRLPGLDEARRNRVIEAMEAAGVSCNVHYKPLPMLSAYRALGYRLEDYPQAYNYYKNEISLPLYSGMTDAEADFVIAALRRVLEAL